MNNSRSCLPRELLLVFGLLASMELSPTFAADPPKSTPAKQQGKSKPKPMSRDQLRACMDEQDRLLTMRETVLKEETSLDRQRAEVARMDAELERKRAALDPADADAKQALIDEEARRNGVGEAYNARLPVLKEQGIKLDKNRQGWVERCADKDFDELDELAIKRERQRAKQRAAKSTAK
ncbi:MAG: hypothetical protein ABJA83_03850 [Burkholderiaceae bacterium]